MSPEPPMPQRCAEGTNTVVDLEESPFRGYHHLTHVLKLQNTPGLWKLREPLQNLLWFDRRCFESEERLLRFLQKRIDLIPEVIQVGEMGLQRFIEGSTLGARYPSGSAVPDAVLETILRLFRQLAGITASDMDSVKRRCLPEDRATDGDSAGFLERLICFTQEQVYEKNLSGYQGLFEDLGLEADSFLHLRKNVEGLKDRPFCFLHADLHRENFILDPAGRLWAIDWELAMLGDPLYDLATHLYLMRYPAGQERLLIQRWCEVVESVREGSSLGWAQDLPRLLAYKRAQSVFTDVIRATQSLGTWGRVDRRELRQTSWKVWDALWGGAGPLGLGSVPTLSEVEASLVRWRRAHKTAGEQGP